MVSDSAGGSLTYSPDPFTSDLIINQTFPTTDGTTISELGYSFEVVGGSFSTGETRSVEVRDGDGSTERFTFTVVVTEAVLRFRIKVFIEGAL